MKDRSMTSLFFWGLFVTILGSGWSDSAYAKRFANEYTEFELPPGWECALEGSEWVCQSENENRKKEAIIILVAKIRGEQDSLDNYMAYLKNPKTYSLPGGKTQVSEAKYTEMKQVNDHRWIDALHLASEVPGFYTRYLATVKEDLGVAVTFSVSKDNYNDYQALFDKVISSLRVFRQKQAQMADFKLKAKDDDLFDSSIATDDDQAFSNLNKGERKTASVKKSGNEDLVLYGVVGVVLAGGFLVLQLRKKGKGKGKKKSKK